MRSVSPTNLVGMLELQGILRFHLINAKEALVRAVHVVLENGL